MKSSPLNQFLLLKKNTPSGVIAIYLNIAIRTAALSLVNIFIPVYLFLKAQSYFGNNIIIGLYGVIAYYFIDRLIAFIFTIPAAQFIAHFGFRISVSLSNFFLILTFIFLNASAHNPIYFVFAAVSSGIVTPFYWIAYHTVFAEDGLVNNFGQEISEANIIGSMAYAVGPALGGIVIVFYGFPVLFVFALLIILLSGLPFLFVPSLPKKNHQVSYSKTLEWLKNPSHQNEEIAYFGRHALEIVGGIFYPIFMFLIAESFGKIGFLASISFFLGTFATYFAGKIYDKNKGPRLLKLGSLITFFIWLGRSFVTQFWQLATLDLSMKSFGAFYSIPFDSMIYQRSRGKNENVLTFITAREIIVSFVYFLTFLIVGLIIPFDWRWKGIFGLAALGSLLSIKMWEKED